MTWKELKDKISLMTEEEQRQEVAVWGENMNLMKATDEQIKKQAEEMAKPEVVTLKVRFYTYGVSYNPYTCVDVEIPFYDDKKIRDMLNKASADIMKWCDKNMEKYNKELKESRSTKKTLRRAKKAYRKSRKAPLKAYIGKRYFIYYISCDYNCPFHINSKLNRHGTRICYSSF